MTDVCASASVSHDILVSGSGLGMRGDREKQGKYGKYRTQQRPTTHVFMSKVCDWHVL